MLSISQCLLEVIQHLPDCCKWAEEGWLLYTDRLTSPRGIEMNRIYDFRGNICGEL